MSDTERENDGEIAVKNIKSCRNRLEILLTTSEPRYINRRRGCLTRRPR